MGIADELVRVREVVLIRLVGRIGLRDPSEESEGFHVRRDSLLLAMHHRQEMADGVELEAQQPSGLGVAPRTGWFSSDRAIREYCEHVWGVGPVPVRV